MKIQIPILIFACAFCLFFDSCTKCELIDQVITDPPPPPPGCEGTFYVLNGEAGVDLVFTLHEFAKPVPEPFATTTLDGPFGTPLMLFTVRSNFSAYDSIAHRYVYRHYTTPSSTSFFSYDVASAAPTITSLPALEVAPVFHKGNLYSIYVEQQGASDWLFDIGKINPVTGQDGIGITGNTVTTNSPLTADYMSSVSNGGDLIYFLSRTNLIEVNLSDNSTRYMDIDPSYNPVDHYVHYFGLEYKPDEGLLLAMKNTTNLGSAVTALVSIDVSGATPVVTNLFDISAAMPAGTDGYINLEFYSTTFDPCDNTYYITSMQAGPSLKTNFIEINLPKNEMKLQTLEGYWYGLEFTPN